MNSNNYNCLVKLAGKSPLTRSLVEGAALGGGIGLGMPMLQVGANAAKATKATAGALTGAAGTAMQALTPKPKTYPAVNPATGGTRVSYKGSRPIGPVETDHAVRKGPLPITPYSSGQIGINSIQQADRQTAKLNQARGFNDSGKQQNAQNLDAMFKSLHETNQRRRAAGLPEHTPQALDLYAPYAQSREDYADAENRLYNDINLSTVTHEAARRGTPMHEAEIEEVRGWLPRSGADREILRSLPNYTEYMGVRLPNDLGLTPDSLGEYANGKPYRQ